MEEQRRTILKFQTKNSLYTIQTDDKGESFFLSGGAIDKITSQEEVKILYGVETLRRIQIGHPAFFITTITNDGGENLNITTTTVVSMEGEIR